MVENAPQAPSDALGKNVRDFGPTAMIALLIALQQGVGDNKSNNAVLLEKFNNLQGSIERIEKSVEQDRLDRRALVDTMTTMGGRITRLEAEVQAMQND